MTRDFLKELGFEDKGIIDKIMSEHGKGIEAQKTLTTKAEGERDALKGQLTSVQESLKKFDGVDIDNLKGQIETLNKDLAQKEADYTAQLAERDFMGMLDTKILSAKGRTLKGIKAELDLDTLRASKNQEADTAAALKALAGTHKYLFGEEEGNESPARFFSGGEHRESGSGGTEPQTLAGALAEHYKT